MIFFPQILRLSAGMTWWSCAWLSMTPSPVSSTAQVSCGGVYQIVEYIYTEWQVSSTQSLHWHHWLVTVCGLISAAGTVARHEDVKAVTLRILTLLLSIVAIVTILAIVTIHPPRPHCASNQMTADTGVVATQFVETQLNVAPSHSETPVLNRAALL